MLGKMGAIVTAYKAACALCMEKARGAMSQSQRSKTGSSQALEIIEGLWLTSRPWGSLAKYYLLHQGRAGEVKQEDAPRSQSGVGGVWLPRESQPHLVPWFCYGSTVIIVCHEGNVNPWEEHLCQSCRQCQPCQGLNVRLPMVGMSSMYQGLQH